MSDLHVAGAGILDNPVLSANNRYDPPCILSQLPGATAQVFQPG